jgi:hypothetical protein
MQKHSASILRGVAVFLLVTGIYGLYRVARGFTLYLYPDEMIYMIFPVAFFAFTVFAGYRLFKQHPNGLKLARTVFALQVFSIYITGLSYFFCTGACLMIYLGSFGFDIHFDIATSMRLSVHDSFGGLNIGVNVLAVAAYIFLGKLPKPAQEEEVKPEDFMPTVKPPTAHRPGETRL